MANADTLHESVVVQSFATPTIVAVSGAVAVVLALSIATQTYLSMLGHGHSFLRILIWQLATWAFWSGAAPFVLRRGACVVADRTRQSASWLALAWLGLWLMALHSVVAAEFTIWIQPFVPVASYGFADAWIAQLPARFVTDLLTFGLLVVLGGALWMSRRARELEVRESRLETELARAQIHALRLEIEPHFLFNTLNAITALVRLQDTRRAVDMLVDLGDFMRSNLERPPEQFAVLETEVAWVRRYVSLQQMRFGDRLDVQYDIDATCLDERVPSLLLLPLVENAFRHGLGRQARAGRLTVSAGRRGDRLRIAIADDGVGVPANFDVASRSGTGLRNVRTRLEHLYGEKASFAIERGPAQGTVVTVHLPVWTPRTVRATA